VDLSENVIEPMALTPTRPFTIGSEVACSDGVCGELSRVVVDPIARVLTHLVVEPTKRWSMGRLVPIDLVDSPGEQIRLRCTIAEFEALDQANVTEFLTGVSDADWNYEQDHVLSLPYYALVINAPSGMDATGSSMGMGLAMNSISYDRVPLGEVEVRRGDRVHATDGEIGRVQGLVINPGDHHVTHVLLEEGHLWGQKEVAIPISAVTGFDSGVQLSLAKDEVRDLPPVDIDHPE
jgi:sporulation protein YlmC with PRC-barrel domain